jgi:hypothetical protein
VSGDLTTIGLVAFLAYCGFLGWLCLRQPVEPQGHDWCSGCQQARAHLKAQHRAKGHVRVLDKRVFDQEGDEG